MTRGIRSAGADLFDALALTGLTTTYFAMLHRGVERRLEEWRARAERIPDRTLREIALARLRDERFNTYVAATCALRAPHARRADVLDAIVARQVAYDYLDGVTEPDSRAAPSPKLHEPESRLLHSAIEWSAKPAGTPWPGPWRLRAVDDDGYLFDLCHVAHEAYWRLPSAFTVAPVVVAAAQRFGEAQTAAHTPGGGLEALSGWAAETAASRGVPWWEYAAGAAAGILCVHTLTAAAAAPTATADDAKRVDDATHELATLATIMDSLVDYHDDCLAGAFNFIAHYPSPDALANAGAHIFQRAATVDLPPRERAHQRAAAIGMVAFYLSAGSTVTPLTAPATQTMAQVPGCWLRPLRTLFRIWRRIDGHRELETVQRSKSAQAPPPSDR